jgi:acetylornithine deacetylase/succinyl-diaminopimelate desuccinylase-like protein
MSMALETYRYHIMEPELWPMLTGAAPYFAFQRVLGLPVICGGIGHGCRAHAASEYMSIQGLREFEKFVSTFLYFIAKDK